jgi:hypothetical protein
VGAAPGRQAGVGGAVVRIVAVRGVGALRNVGAATGRARSSRAGIPVFGAVTRVLALGHVPATPLDGADGRGAGVAVIRTLARRGALRRTKAAAQARARIGGARVIVGALDGGGAFRSVQATSLGAAGIRGAGIPIAAMGCFRTLWNAQAAALRRAQIRRALIRIITNGRAGALTHVGAASLW